MREEHTFQFTAAKIHDAAEDEARYHRKREAYWDKEYVSAVERVRETASVKITEAPVTGGMRADVQVDYGDPSAYRRMAEAYEKRQLHGQEAERFESDAKLYGSQTFDRVYELSSNDVHYFRLSGRPREE